jgi:hypothetical protein
MWRVDNMEFDILTVDILAFCNLEVGKIPCRYHVLMHKANKLQNNDFCQFGHTGAAVPAPTLFVVSQVLEKYRSPN